MPPPAPLPGAVVHIRGERWRVDRCTSDGDVSRVEVATGAARRTFLTPFDLVQPVSARERCRRSRPQRARARLAAIVAGTLARRTIGSALEADLTLLAYQLEPVLAFECGIRRLLLADQVGLGKTVQAGLVIAEHVRRGPDARVLVIVPAGLASQWATELLRRFGLTCLEANRAGLNALGRLGAFGTNPWQHAGVWLGSLDFLKQPHVLSGLPLTAWDLVVVDEAHDACGDSERHQACAEIARRARRLLLLTATPHAGDPVRFARLTSLGKLERRDRPMTIMRRTRADLGISGTRVVRWHRVPLSHQERRALDALVAFERLVVMRTAPDRGDSARLLLSVFRKRALSTSHALRASIRRRLDWLEGERVTGELLWHQHSFEFGEPSGPDDVLTREEFSSLSSDIGLEAPTERAWLRRLLALTSEAENVGGKIARLVAMVNRTREPLVVFTEFRDSAIAVGAALGRVASIALLHGGLSTMQRAAAQRTFLAGAARVLVTTDVAGQGLNLQQGGRWVVNLELPWNPARLEQRAGRVDRIGQSRRAHVSLLVARHPAEAGLLERLAARVLTARAALGSDVLGAALPDERAVGRCLFAGSPDPAAVSVESPASGKVLLRRAWSRAAASAARDLASRRLLLAAWRGRSAAAAVDLVAARPRGARLASIVGPGSLVLFQIPVHDGHGTLLFWRLVAVRVDIRATHGGLNRDVLARAGSVAAAWTERALRRDRGSEAARARAASKVDQAIGRHCRAQARRVGRQPGLFDARADRARFKAGVEIDQMALETERRDDRARSGLVAGRPIVRLVMSAGC